MDWVINFIRTFFGASPRKGKVVINPSLPTEPSFEMWYTELQALLQLAVNTARTSQDSVAQEKINEAVLAHARKRISP